MDKRGRTTGSIRGTIGMIFNEKINDDEIAFYRGHSNKTYDCIPYVFRTDEYKSNESVMFREMLIASPKDFYDDENTFDQLARMQHHSLPTRLLDISSNPLIALYFACKDNSETIAQLILFKVKKEKIKFFDSDIVSCLSNLAKLDASDKKNIDTTLELKEFNDSKEIQNLLYHIKKEKPHFQEKIDPKDLERIVCVKSRMNNRRILSQAGAFLLFGLEPQLKDEPKGGDVWIENVYNISPKHKKDIIEQLDTLNINESTVFPNIESSANYLKEKFRTKK